MPNAPLTFDELLSAAGSVDSLTALRAVIVQHLINYRDQGHTSVDHWNEKQILVHQVNRLFYAMQGAPLFRANVYQMTDYTREDETQRPGESEAVYRQSLGLPPIVDTNDDALAKAPIFDPDAPPDWAGH